VVEKTRGKGKKDGEPAWVAAQDAGFMRGQN